MLKGSKVIKSKAPNLEGLLQTPSEVPLSLSCTSHGQEEAVRGARMKIKHFLAMRKDTEALTSVWIQECVD